VAKFYDSPVVSTDGKSVSLPYSYVNDNKIVNVEVKLQNTINSLGVGGRTVTMGSYRDGGYLPLLVIVTPQQHLIAAVRVCEPCHSFSFSIVDGILQCDAPCHTKWNLETFEGIGGICANDPPPQIPASVVGDNIVIDISHLDLKAIP
jgi:hypothetical protein